ncbi:PREDICTED: uncharacterized protein LOC108378884 [Rhagoletis zephyria]|uniref:uncharacterized protein LOC108378884 n=1 Tax=Rhagoletis zephyria TaxID=28612 RepID=UPI00081146FD|nr:PREDICTED: uncharacterized protein LOC108378884 [Rhagoletis zephyria]XP_036319731.1 uncharacterized protein LOC118734126 [Rhagoletis pomonella]
MNQLALNDLCRDFNLSKEKSELLASRLQERGYLESETKVTYFRNRSKQFEQYFSKTDDFCYCNNVNAMFAAFGENHNSDEWRIFIDGSKYSVKAVLLHKGNKEPSIPIGHSTKVKETYETMKELLKLIDYSSCNWKICCDLNVVAILTGLQGGYTKYSCFLCLWDSRADEKHFTQREWPKRNDHVVGKSNVLKTALVEKKQRYFSNIAHKTRANEKFCQSFSKKSGK